MSESVSIAKPNDHAPNEDAVFCSPQCIAVSDGAGGCGLYADKWSRYLIEQLPKDAPLCSFTELDEWLDGIWEAFYDEHEELAKWATASCLTSSTTKDHAQPSQRLGLQSQGNANGWRMGIVSFSIIAIRPDCWNIALHDWQT